MPFAGAMVSRPSRRSGWVAVVDASLGLYQAVVEASEAPGERAAGAGPDLLPIDGGDRHQFEGGVGEEGFVGFEKVRDRECLRYRRDPLARAEFQHRRAGDAGEAAGAQRRGCYTAPSYRK